MSIPNTGCSRSTWSLFRSANSAIQFSLTALDAIDERRDRCPSTTGPLNTAPQDACLFPSRDDGSL